MNFQTVIPDLKEGERSRNDEAEHDLTESSEQAFSFSQF